MSFDGYDSRCEITEIVGKTFTRVESTDDEVNFWAEPKTLSFSLFHNQDCCEHVYLEDVVGDLADLENTPILVAEEASSRNLPPLHPYEESHTWTFYKFSTIKGSVTLRWYGRSNGYYKIFIFKISPICFKILE